MTSMNFRTVIAERIEQRFAEHYDFLPEEMRNQGGICLHWALVAMEVLRQTGRRAILQGGTSLWPRIPFKPDNDPRESHFGYTWDPDSDVCKKAIADGLMPPMHVWVALPKEKEIVDMTTRYLPAECQKCFGLKWTAPAPPKYLWANERQLPLGVAYIADRDACRLARQLAGIEGGRIVKPPNRPGKWIECRPGIWIRDRVSEGKNEFQEDRRDKPEIF
jgi:hypothetical protein